MEQAVRTNYHLNSHQFWRIMSVCVAMFGCPFWTYQMLPLNTNTGADTKAYCPTIAPLISNNVTGRTISSNINNLMAYALMHRLTNYWFLADNLTGTIISGNVNNLMTYALKPNIITITDSLTATMN